MKSTLVLVFVIAFATGVFLASLISLSYYFGLLFIFLGLIIWPLNKKFLFFSLALVAFGAGFFWYEYRSLVPESVFVLEKNIGEKIILQGVIIEEPDERENYTRLVFQAEGAKILLLANRYPVFKYGDKVEVGGLLQKPEILDNPTAGSAQGFDWPAYLAKDDIYLEMFYPDIKFVSANQGSWAKRQLLLFKEKILFNISRVIPEPHSALLGGLTFGAKRSMPADLLEDFRKTGIVHIVVLSGYNVTIVADAIMRFFSFLPVSMGIGLGALGIVGFAVMAGASATVVRASIMALLVLLARATGRIYEISVALFVAGFLMVLHNPKILRFDASFQLSFLAAMALIYLAPQVEKKLMFLPKKWKIREVITATISTQIFVLPLLLYKTGLFSAVGLPVNLLVLFSVPATMFFGFFTAATGFLSYFLSVPFGWISYVFLAYQLKVVELFSNLPFSSFIFSEFPLWLMLLVYVGYAILIFYGVRKNKF